MKVQQFAGSLAKFSEGLNKKGTLANELTTDTIVFNSIKSSVVQLQKMTDTATVFITNLKEVSGNTKSSLAVLFHDEESGAHLKETLKKIASSTKKLDEDLEAAQHNIFPKRLF